MYGPTIMPRILSKYWCFTLNNYTETQVESIKVWLRAECNYAIYQKEVGESGTPHLQGYFILSDRKDFTWVRRRFPGEGAHFEKAKGSPLSNKEYCSKEGGTEPFEHGDCPQTTQGTRSDLAEVVSAIREKRTMHEIADQFPEQWVKFHRGLESLASRLSERRDWKTEVSWYWGPTGSGKSRRAFEESPGAYYKMPCNKWWDGYDNHEIVVIDDYRRDMCTFGELLRLFDRYPHTVETKGGSRSFVARRIIVTSSSKPQDIWESRTEEDLNQLLRRIENIVHFDML